MIRLLNVHPYISHSCLQRLSRHRHHRMCRAHTRVPHQKLMLHRAQPCKIKIMALFTSGNYFDKALFLHCSICRLDYKVPINRKFPPLFRSLSQQDRVLRSSSREFGTLAAVGAIT